MVTLEGVWPAAGLVPLSLKSKPLFFSSLSACNTTASLILVGWAAAPAQIVSGWAQEAPLGALTGLIGCSILRAAELKGLSDHLARLHA